MTSLEDNAVRATTQVKQFGDIVREACLRAFGHVMRRDSGYTGQRMLNVELPDRWKRETPQWRFMDVVKEALWMVAVTEEDFI